MSTFLFARLSFVFVLVCAAVESFIRAAPAEKAYPYIHPLDSGADSTSMTYRRFGLPPSEPGTINTGTAQSWKARGGDAPPVIQLPPNLLRKEHLNYNLNSRHNQPHYEATGQVHGGQRLAEIKPEISTSANSDLQPPRVNHNPFFQSQNHGLPGLVGPYNTNSQSWHSSMTRKSSKQLRPHPQSSLQVQRARNYEKIPRSDASTLPESRSDYRIDRQSPYNPPVSFRSRGYQSPQSNSMGHGNIQEAYSESSKGQSNNPPLFLNQKSSLLPSQSGGFDSSAVNPETSSITTLGEFPPNGNAKTSYRKVQSLLLRNVYTTDAPRGVNNQHSQHHGYRGQDLNQQSKANMQSAKSILKTSEENIAGPNSNVKKPDPAVVIYRSQNKETSTPFEDSYGANRNTESGLSGRGNSWEPIDNMQLKSMRLSNLPKYSFGQRERSRETNSKSTSIQDFGSADSVNTHLKSGVVGVGKSDPKQSPDVSKLVTTTRVEPQPKKILKHGENVSPFNRPYKTDKEFQGVTYDDVIGSASFSSFKNKKIATRNGKRFEMEAVQKEIVLQNQTVDLAGVMGESQNATEDYSIGGEKLHLEKAEAETELKISDLSVSRKESEARAVLRGLQPDPEDYVERDSLLELYYLRTSTGNISFQSLNLNL